VDRVRTRILVKVAAIVEWESLPPEGLGFLDDVHQSRVSRS
jgi:hypothetical protein